MPELVSLAEALESLSGWQQRARAALAMATPLDDLQTLCKEAVRLSVAAPEQAAVQVTQVPA